MSVPHTQRPPGFADNNQGFTLSRYDGPLPLPTGREVQRVTIDGTIAVDASLSEKHSSSVEVTKHPIEAGADPIDHARELPDKLVLEGVFMDSHPNRNQQNLRGGPIALRGSGYAEQNMDALATLKSAKRAVTVVTAYKTYENMMLTSLEVPRDSKSGDAIRFSATFEQVRFVSSATATLAPTPKDPTKANVKKEQPKKVATPVKEQDATIIKGFTNWAGWTDVGSGAGAFQ